MTKSEGFFRQHEKGTRAEYIREAGKILLGIELAAKDIHKGSKEFNSAIGLIQSLFEILKVGKITLSEIGTSKEQLSTMLFQSVAWTPKEKEELKKLMTKQPISPES